MLEKIKNNINNLKKNGFFALVISNFINKILLFCNGIILIRILSQNEYGIYSYYQNILMFFLFMSGFGNTSGFLQFGSQSQNKDEQEEYFKYSLKNGILADFSIGIVIFLLSFSKKILLEGSQNYLRGMLFIPLLTTLMELIIIKERVEYNNKRVAILLNIKTMIDIFFLLIGAYYYGITGIIVGKYIGQILFLLFSFKTYKTILERWRKIQKISKEKAKKLNRFSYISVFNGIISQILYIIDIFLIGILITDKVAIANYKTATLIPFALNFLPQLISNYLYPYFAKNYLDKNYIKKKYLEVLKYNSILNFLISVFLVIFSKLIIINFFGKEYIGIETYFKILSIGYFFAATLRIPGSYILSAIGKVEYITYNSIICAFFNIILDIILIKKYGVLGAATTTVFIFILSGILSNLFLWKELNKI